MTDEIRLIKIPEPCVLALQHSLGQAAYSLSALVSAVLREDESHIRVSEKIATIHLAAKTIKRTVALLEAHLIDATPYVDTADVAYYLRQIDNVLKENPKVRGSTGTH